LANLRQTRTLLPRHVRLRADFACTGRALSLVEANEGWGEAALDGLQKAVDFEILMSYNPASVGIVCTSKIARSERHIAE